MNKEKDIISTMANMMPRPGDQMNSLFESDSEILQHGDQKLLFTIDEYSAEDQFRDYDPYILGWNLAAATLSDIFACGGIPKYYAHCLNIPSQGWNKEYIRLFSKGISEVLVKVHAGFIGGDFGTAKEWHYTGVAFGEADTPVTRRGAIPGDMIIMTGKIGLGNFEAALNIYSKKSLLRNLLGGYKNRISVRFEESRLMSEYATACIDSSDGVLNSLITLSEINHTGFELTHTPYIAAGLSACKLLSKPKELLLVGECGEYELIFTIVEKDISAFYQKAREKGLSFTTIGRMTRHPEQSLITSEKMIDFTDFNIRGRDYENISLYLEELTNYLVNHEKQYNYA